jgi:hypothetical protein
MDPTTLRARFGLTRAEGPAGAPARHRRIIADRRGPVEHPLRDRPLSSQKVFEKIATSRQTQLVITILEESPRILIGPILTIPTNRMGHRMRCSMN